MYFSCFLLSFSLLFFGTYSVDTDGDVLILTDANFQDQVVKYDVMLIEFYAPWCGHCKKLAPEYVQAAASLKKKDLPVALAKVDCTVETKICSTHGVSGYPTLKIFKHGEFSKEYDGPRENAGIVKKMMKESGPVSKKLETAEKATAFLKTDQVSVIGVFDSEDSALAKTFLKVADSMPDVKFAHTVDDEVKEALKRTESGIVLYRPKVLQSKFEDAEVVCKDTSEKMIKSCLQGAAMGLAGVRTQDNAENFPKPLFVVYYNVDIKMDPKGTKYWRNRVMKVGKKIQDEGESVFFAISHKGDMERELTECGFEGEQQGPVVCAWDEKNRKFKMTADKFNVDTFEQFIRDVQAGKVEAYMKSEPIPESQDDGVKTAVAKNFDEIVNDPTKDVLIEFYAPWCGHCKTLAPKLEELALKLKDETSVTIAKMDATANDVPPQYEVRGFPTIYYAPKGSKDSPKKYEGGREVADFIKYLTKESTDGLNIAPSKPEKKKKAKKTEL